MSVHADREAFYRRYDAAVARLPADLQKDASPLNCGEDRDGFHFYDKWGRKTAVVPEAGDVTIVGQVVEKSAQSEPTTSRTTYASKDLLKKTVLAALKRVGIRIRALAKGIVELDERIKAIEGSQVSKSLDVEAFDELANASERLDRLEAAMAEMDEYGFRYRGYWRDGVNAKRGDAYTHDGSLWYANRSTDDRPCNESADWAVVARKGRDAR